MSHNSQSSSHSGSHSGSLSDLEEAAALLQSPHTTPEVRRRAEAYVISLQTTANIFPQVQLVIRGECSVYAAFFALSNVRKTLHQHWGDVAHRVAPDDFRALLDAVFQRVILDSCHERGAFPPLILREAQALLALLVKLGLVEFEVTVEHFYTSSVCVLLEGTWRRHTAAPTAASAGLLAVLLSTVTAMVEDFSFMSTRRSPAHHRRGATSFRNMCLTPTFHLITAMLTQSVLTALPPNAHVPLPTTTFDAACCAGLPAPPPSSQGRRQPTQEGVDDTMMATGDHFNVAFLGTPNRGGGACASTPDGRGHGGVFVTPTRHTPFISPIQVLAQQSMNRSPVPTQNHVNNGSGTNGNSNGNSSSVDSPEVVHLVNAIDWAQRCSYVNTLLVTPALVSAILSALFTLLSFDFQCTPPQSRQEVAGVGGQARIHGEGIEQPSGNGNGGSNSNTAGGDDSKGETDTLTLQFPQDWGPILTRNNLFGVLLTLYEGRVLPPGELLEELRRTGRQRLTFEDGCPLLGIDDADLDRFRDAGVYGLALQCITALTCARRTLFMEGDARQRWARQVLGTCVRLLRHPVHILLGDGSAASIFASVEFGASGATLIEERYPVPRHHDPDALAELCRFANRIKPNFNLAELLQTGPLYTAWIHLLAAFTVDTFLHWRGRPDLATVPETALIAYNQEIYRAFENTLQTCFGERDPLLKTNPLLSVYFPGQRVATSGQTHLERRDARLNDPDNFEVGIISLCSTWSRLVDATSAATARQALLSELLPEIVMAFVHGRLEVAAATIHNAPGHRPSTPEEDIETTQVLNRFASKLLRATATVTGGAVAKIFVHCGGAYLSSIPAIPSGGRADEVAEMQLAHILHLFAALIKFRSPCCIDPVADESVSTSISTRADRAAQTDAHIIAAVFQLLPHQAQRVQLSFQRDSGQRVHCEESAAHALEAGIMQFFQSFRAIFLGASKDIERGTSDSIFIICASKTLRLVGEEMRREDGESTSRSALVVHNELGNVCLNHAANALNMWSAYSVSLAQAWTPPSALHHVYPPSGDPLACRGIIEGMLQLFLDLATSIRGSPIVAAGRPPEPPKEVASIRYFLSPESTQQLPFLQDFRFQRLRLRFRRTMAQIFFMDGVTPEQYHHFISPMRAMLADLHQALLEGGWEWQPPFGGRSFLRQDFRGGASEAVAQSSGPIFGAFKESRNRLLIAGTLSDLRGIFLACMSRRVYQLGVFDTLFSVNKDGRTVVADTLVWLADFCSHCNRGTGTGNGSNGGTGSNPPADGPEFRASGVVSNDLVLEIQLLRFVEECLHNRCMRVAFDAQSIHGLLLFKFGAVVLDILMRNKMTKMAALVDAAGRGGVVPNWCTALPPLTPIAGAASLLQAKDALRAMGDTEARAVALALFGNPAYSVLDETFHYNFVYKSAYLMMGCAAHLLNSRSCNFGTMMYYGDADVAVVLRSGWQLLCLFTYDELALYPKVLLAYFQLSEAMLAMVMPSPATSAGISPVPVADPLLAEILPSVQTLSNNFLLYVVQQPDDEILHVLLSLECCLDDAVLNASSATRRFHQPAMNHAATALAGVLRALVEANQYACFGDPFPRPPHVVLQVFERMLSVLGAPSDQRHNRSGIAPFSADYLTRLLIVLLVRSAEDDRSNAWLFAQPMLPILALRPSALVEAQAYFERAYSQAIHKDETTSSSSSGNGSGSNHSNSMANGGGSSDISGGNKRLVASAFASLLQGMQPLCEMHQGDRPSGDSPTRPLCTCAAPADHWLPRVSQDKKCRDRFQQNLTNFCRLIRDGT